MKSVLRAMLIVVALGLGYATAANAALLFENATVQVPQGPGTLTGGTWGTRFTVGDQPLSVTQLGTFSFADDAMRVGIWRVADGTLVESAWVPTVANGTGMWNFAGITPFTLLANTTYLIGAETQTDTIGWVSSYQLGGGITSAGGAFNNSNSFGGNFSYPTLPVLNGILAANAVVAAIPEPSSFALLALGLAGLWIARRRLR